MDYKNIQDEAQSNFYIKQGELRPPIIENETYSCQICTNEASGNFYNTGFMLCVICADYISNVYTHMTTGRFSSWNIDDGLRRQTNNRKKTISQTLRKQVFERDEYRCVNCKTYKSLTVDHIHPESKGGTTELGNLQTLCQSCNSSKGIKTTSEWRRSQ